MSEQLLRQIANDISEMRKRIVSLEQSVEEINTDMHEVRPEYLKKLEKIDMEETVSKEKIEKKFGVKF